MNANTRRSRAAKALLFAAATVSMLGCTAIAKETATAKPKIIFIFVDNFGFGDLGCYGSKLHRTPHVDRMAAEGMRLTSFYSASGVCTPSRAVLMTGCYPRRVNMHVSGSGSPVLKVMDTKGLNPSEITIAKLLRGCGYTTMCIGKWHLGCQAPFLPTRHGFDHFFGIPYSDDMTPSKNNPHWPPLPLMRQEKVIEAPVDRDYLTKRYTEETIRFLAENKERPFFLYLPHAMPGSTARPFASPAFQGKSKNGPYGDSVEELDWSTGEILAALKKLGLDEKTLVVWTSDNGAVRRNPPQGSNAPLKGWGYDTSEGAMRMPCIVRWPGKVPAGKVCDELCAMMDWLPTFAKLGGGEPPKDRIIDGHDIRPLLFGEPGAKSRYDEVGFFYYMMDQLQAVRAGPWKLYLPLENKLMGLRRNQEKFPAALYDVRHDLGETKEVSDEHPEIVARLAALADKARADLGDLKRPGKNQRPAGHVDNPKPQVLAADSQQHPNILLVLGDNWGWPHASAYGDLVVKTPNFDRLAREGVLFTHAFCPAPSCTPTRNAMLTGQATHRLENGASLWSHLPKKFTVYPDLLETAGYTVGYCGKGWSPGDFKAGGRERNPAGPQFKDFSEFLKSAPPEKPFCFWLGNIDTARNKIKAGAGVTAGMKLDAVRVPPYLPDTPEVRGDILDYYEAVQRYDAVLGETLRQLEDAGRAPNTVVMAASDNGWQFPRGLANCYDSGTRVPLVVRWPGVAKPGRRVDDFADLTDVAPTFMEIGGLKPLPEMTGRSFAGLLRGETQPGRDAMFMERERHANVRRGDLGYPCRAIRTQQFLYIRNLHPERWAAGDPEFYWSVGPYGDVDGSPTKELILARKDEPAMKRFYQLNFAKRPAEELYDLAKDPHQIVNVADRPEYADAKKPLRARLDQWMKATADPRAVGDTDVFDKYPYYAKRLKKK